MTGGEMLAGVSVGPGELGVRVGAPLAGAVGAPLGGADADGGVDEGSGVRLGAGVAVAEAMGGNDGPGAHGRPGTQGGSGAGDWLSRMTPAATPRISTRIPMNATTIASGLVPDALGVTE